MTKRGVVATSVLTFIVCMAPNLVLAQDNQAASVKPAPGPAQVLLESWNEIGRKLIANGRGLPRS